MFRYNGGMDRIAVAGLSIHGTDVSGLETVQRPEPAALAPFLRELADVVGASEAVFLATCNRVEVIFAREEGEAPEETDLDDLAAFLTRSASDLTGDAARASALRERLTLRRGRDAVAHLFRVAASLDSLVIGEDQILGQVRDAYGTASDIGLVGPLLGPLFHHALAVGKQVRSETELARHPVSVVNLAVHALVDRAEAVPEGRSPVVAVIGAGEMGALLARALNDAGLPPAVIVNRSVEKARLVAEDCGARALDLEAFRAGDVAVDAVACATSAPGVVLDEPTLKRLAASAPSGEPLLGVDLAVPRDLDRSEDPALRILDLDDLRAIADRNRARRAEAAAVAEQIVDRKVETFARRSGEAAAAPVVGELRDAAEELLTRELGGLLTGRLAHLEENDRRAVERWARSTFGRLMHMPMTAIKRLAAHGTGTETRVDEDASLPLRDDP